MEQEPEVVQSCSNCRFCFALLPARYSMVSVVPPGVGRLECHRLPPQVTSISSGVFPTVSADMWCGEWKGIGAK